MAGRRTAKMTNDGVSKKSSMPRRNRTVKTKKRKLEHRSASSRGFLDLAPELRNCIYAEVIESHRDNSQPGLVNACRQTRADALSMFYSSHTFVFTKRLGVNYAQAVHEWAEAIGPENARLVRNLRFEMIFESRYPFEISIQARFGNPTKTLGSIIETPGTLPRQHCLKDPRDDLLLKELLEPIDQEEWEIPADYLSRIYDVI